MAQPESTVTSVIRGNPILPVLCPSSAWGSAQRLLVDMLVAIYHGLGGKHLRNTTETSHRIELMDSLNSLCELIQGPSDEACGPVFNYLWRRPSSKGDYRGS